MFKEYDELIIKLPVKKAFSIVRQMIKEKIQIVITVFGVEKEDHNIYGRVCDNKIIYYNRPMNTQGIRYKTILTFNAYENDSCKIIIERTKILFYILLWLIVTVLSFIIFSLIIFNTDNYITTSNNVSKIVNEHPYYMFIFPSIISFIFLIFIPLMYGQKRNSYSIYYRIMDKLKYEEKINNNGTSPNKR
jgi:hypothetical protein